jgi:hypothetical protein
MVIALADIIGEVGQSQTYYFRVIAQENSLESSSSDPATLNMGAPASAHQRLSLGLGLGL